MRLKTIVWLAVLAFAWLLLPGAAEATHEKECSSLPPKAKAECLEKGAKLPPHAAQKQGAVTQKSTPGQEAAKAGQLKAGQLGTATQQQQECGKRNAQGIVVPCPDRPGQGVYAQTGGRRRSLLAQMSSSPRPL